MVSDHLISPYLVKRLDHKSFCSAQYNKLKILIEAEDASGIHYGLKKFSCSISLPVQPSKSIHIFTMNTMIREE